MNILKVLFFKGFNRTKLLFSWVVLCMIFTTPAHADILDAFNLSQFVPLILDSMMHIATALYNKFVGNGNGLIYLIIYVFLGFYIGLYLVKMYLPKDWLGFFGFSGGGEMWDNKATGWSIVEEVAKPCLRAIIAIVLLLQIKPVYVTEWLINPFLEFGSVYTEQVLKVANVNTSAYEAPECPESVLTENWISQDSCKFLVEPVHVISVKNNSIIKYGFRFLKSGLRGLLTPIPHGGEDFLNVITGILLIVAFVSANLFMALLIIQAIFDFCLALIMYPFNVLTWVVKKTDAKAKYKWFDILPPFKQIIDSLKKLVITMIACAFILCINLAVISALFNWSSSAFNVAAGGTATSNFPTVTNSGMHFGHHFMLWLSSILTFFLMQNIFKVTRERLQKYTGTDKNPMYDNLTGDAKKVWGKVTSAPDTIKTWWQTGKKIKSIIGK